MAVKLNSVAYWNKEFEREYKEFILGIGKKKYNRWAGERFDIASLTLPPKGVVLDVGCGLGHFTRYILAKRPFLKVEGTDCAERAIFLAKELDKRIKYFISEPNKISTVKKYDVITCLETIEHIEDDEAFLKELKAHLKPKGQLIISTPIAPPGKQTKISIEHTREYYECEFYNLLKRYFKNVKIIKPPIKFYEKSHLTVNPCYMIAIATDDKIDKIIK